MPAKHGEHAPVPEGIQVNRGRMKVFSLVAFFGITWGALAGLFVLWFFPWILVFHLGFLVYFPYDPDGVARYARLVGPVTSAWSTEWLSQDELPRHCKNALVAAEDTKFFEHNGIDFESLQESYAANRKSKRIRRGGSTLTQQLVKNAFLSREKSYLRKVREIIGALMLDATLSKESQLSWYLNIVEFGPRTYGLQAAAQRYFHKDARKLTREECVSLIAVLPAPNKWNASLEKKRPTRFFLARTSTIQRRMNIMGFGRDGTTAARVRPSLEAIPEMPPLPTLPEAGPGDGTLGEDFEMSDDGTLEEPGASPSENDGTSDEGTLPESALEPADESAAPAPSMDGPPEDLSSPLP